MHLLLNLLFAILAFFIVRYVGGMVAPDGPDQGRIITIIAIIVGIVVFFADFASQVTLR